MIEDIYAFCIIAKHKSFSKAARELELSTPVITRRLSRLEKTLNTRLLHRTTRKVTLTEAGLLYFSEVSDILNALEASKEAVKSLSSQVSGTLKICMPVSLSQCFVIPAMKKFLTQYPNLKIRIRNGHHALDLLHHGFDLVIQCGELVSSSYHYKKIATMKKVMCASQDYLEKYGFPQTLDDLNAHNCLHHHHEIYNKHWIVHENNRYKEIPIQGNIQVENPADLKRLAIDGVGIAYLPLYYVHNELKSGKLISVLDSFQLLDHHLYAVYPTKKYLAKKTHIFLNFLIELLKPVVNLD